jgi:hypothetical protein
MRALSWGKGIMAAVALVIAGPGCGKGSSVAVVTVDATGIVRNVKTLSVRVTQGGQPAQPIRIALASVVDLPPPQTFGLRFGADRSGSLVVDVDALDVNDQLVAPRR